MDTVLLNKSTALEAHFSLLVNFCASKKDIALVLREGGRVITLGSRANRVPVPMRSSNGGKFGKREYLRNDLKLRYLFKWKILVNIYSIKPVNISNTCMNTNILLCLCVPRTPFRPHCSSLAWKKEHKIA